MSKFKSFRIGWNLFEWEKSEDRKATAFYFKIEDEDHVLCNFCVSEDGLYYYRKGSEILSAKEKEETRKSWDGFLSFKQLDQLFRNLDQIGCSSRGGDDSQLSIEKVGEEIIIRKTTE